MGQFDRTASAVLTSSDPKVVMIEGNRACAVAPGKAEITAKVSGSDKSGKAVVTVNNEEITQLSAEPGQLDMSLGDIRQVQVLGRAACGIHEMFPQADLKLSAGGSKPEAISISGFDQVHAVAEGIAAVDIQWRGKLNAQVPVTVANNFWTDLHIEPGHAVVHPGEALRYEVTAMKGGQRRVLGPEDGVQLAVSDRGVAQVLDGINVGAKQEGRTSVIAKLGPLAAEAALDVTSGERIVSGDRIGSGRPRHY